MNLLWSTGVFLTARDPRLDGIASGFRQRQTTTDSGTVLGMLAALGGLLLLFWLISLLSDWLERRGARPSPRRLFFSLAKTHHLSWSETWLLWRLARRQQRADPARIFLEPEWLEPGPAGSLPDRRAAQLESLRARLFAGLQKGESRLGLPTSGDPSSPNTTEAKLPLFPSPERPQLDLPPWTSPTNDLPTVHG